MDLPLAFKSNATLAANPLHSYYPLNAIIPGYEVNSWSVPALLTVFFGACTLLFTATYFVAKSIQPKLSRGDLLTTMWFVLSGSIHIIFEGYYAKNFADLGSKQTLLGQLWKEYAFSDSRYLTSNAIVLCVEGVTAVFWGPGCLLVAWLLLHRHPMRYPLQALVSFGQLYGDVLYYGTVAFDHIVLDITYSRPEAFYFWFYFVFMNAIWIVIPGVLVAQSCIESASAISTVANINKSKKAQ